MKRKFIFTLTFTFCTFLQIIAQEEQSINNIDKYKQYGLIWGLIKYHHSEVSKGKYNWDEIFIENFDKLEDINTQKELDVFLINFVLSVKPSKLRTVENDNNLFKNNMDYGWIEKYSQDSELYTVLKQLRDNTNISNYYVSNQSLSKIPTFENEKGFKSFDYKVKSNRLLELFSFWNAIQYHYVNKYLMDKNWFSQLEYFVFDFLNAKTKLEYELAKTKLIVSLNDSHSYYFAKPVSDSLLKFRPPFDVKVVNDTLVITGMLNKLGKKDDLKLGDLIVEVDNMDIKSLSRKKIGPFFSSSNDSYLKKWTDRWIMRDVKDSIKVKIISADNVKTKYLHLYKTFTDKDYSSLPFFQVKKEWQIIDNNIGYINLETISKDGIKEAFEEFSGTDGIIIDLRNYPKNISENDITKYIYPDRKKFIKVLFPMINRPSMANFDEPLISSIADPFKSGGKNSKYYNKKIILLVDHTTQSKAEFIGMAIQASPNCLTIGENTAGSIMNITSFKMPDGTNINFTSMGAFYPDGDGAQRKGLKIDYFVIENTANFIQDQYCIKAIELIKSIKK